MNVLAAIFVPPHLRASGAATAGKSLSRAIANFCEIDVAIMSSFEAAEPMGKSRLLHRKSSNALAFTKRILPSKFRTLLYRSDIPELIRNGDYDLVHLHNPIPALEMKRTAAACVRKGIPYVVSSHGFVESASGGSAYQLKHLYEKVAWSLFLERPFKFVVRNASRVFALSPFDYPILNRLGVDNTRIRVVTNGANPRFYAKRSPKQIEAVYRFGLPRLSDKRVPVCIFLGNHTRNKGVEILLDAFSRTSRPFILIVCGEQRDSINYTEYARGCRQNQRMVFTNWVAEEDLICLLQYADLFVYPTLADTLPLAILEAMAAGLAVLSTDVGGIPYQVDETCGVLVEPGDPEAITKAFENMTEDMQRLKRMGEVARQGVMERFDWAKSAKSAVAFYKEILDADVSFGTRQSLPARRQKGHGPPRSNGRDEA